MSIAKLKIPVISSIILTGIGLLPAAVCAQPDRSEFDEAMRQWKATYVELLEAYTQFRTCEEWESDDVRERFLELKRQGDAQKLQAIERAAELYGSSDRNIEELNRLLSGLPDKLFENYQYATAAHVGRALLRHDPNNMAVMFDTIKSAFFSNQFELAASLMDAWRQQFGPIPAELEPFQEFLPGYRAAWKREMERQSVAESGQPLPQLEFHTENGSFVVELFEDDYPEIVNNLVGLIADKNLYYGFWCFEVLEHQVVRAGCPRNDGTIMFPVAPVTEEEVANSSKHFRGTFSLIVNPANRTASTQFVISRIPMPELDGRNLVIGRVVEGMETVDQLTATQQMDENLQPVRIEDAQPVVIESVEVLRKRDHEYKFTEPDLPTQRPANQ